MGKISRLITSPGSALMAWWLVMMLFIFHTKALAKLGEMRAALDRAECAWNDAKNQADYMESRWVKTSAESKRLFDLLNDATK